MCGYAETDLILQGCQVSFQPLVFPEQGLNAGEVTTEIIRRHQLLLLLNPADCLIHIPVGQNRKFK